MDKRKERRIKVDMPATICYQNSSVAAKIDNLSRLGALVESYKQIATGREISLLMDIPSLDKSGGGAAEINCRGHIFRSKFLREECGEKCYGLGVFFVGFKTKQDRQRLSDYIDFLIANEDKEIKKTLTKIKESRKNKVDKKSGDAPKAGKNNFQKEIRQMFAEIRSILDEMRVILKKGG